MVPFNLRSALKAVNRGLLEKAPCRRDGPLPSLLREEKHGARGSSALPRLERGKRQCIHGSIEKKVTEESGKCAVGVS